MTITVHIYGPTEPVERAIRNLRLVFDVLAETTQPSPPMLDPIEKIDHLYKTIIIAAQTTTRINIKITADKLGELQ